jgi:hypothetical protein
MVHKFEDKHCMIHGSYPGMFVSCPTCPQPPLTDSDIAKIEAMEVRYEESDLRKAMEKIERLETIIDILKPAMQTIKNEAENQYGGEVDATWLLYFTRNVLEEIK